MPRESSRDRKLLGTREDTQFYLKVSTFQHNAGPSPMHRLLHMTVIQGGLPLLSGVGILHAQS